MGILNVTPDSFSDAGHFLSVDAAVKQAAKMVCEGADLIDVGGESTQPGSDRVSSSEQLNRIVPVIAAARRQLPEHCAISVDTTRADVAEAALDAGADIVNDVSAGRDDPEMLSLVARRAVPVVLMHMQGTPKDMQANPSYVDVVNEVRSFLVARAQTAEELGVPRGNIIIDPGIGFGKRREDNLRLLAELEQLVATGYSVLLGASRKRFMGAICGESRPRELGGATIATTALGVLKGVKIFRVHDVAANRQAVDVTAAIMSAVPPR